MIIKVLAKTVFMVGIFVCILSFHSYAETSEPAKDSTATASASVPDTDAKPAAPSDLKASIVSPTAIQFNWKDNSKLETGFTITAKSVDAGSALYVRTVPAGTEKYVLDSMIPNLFYHIRISAIGKEGSSDWSNDVIIELAAPKTPINPVATALSETSVKLTWNDIASNESGYQILRQKSNGRFVQIGTTAKDTTSYTDDGLEPGTGYTYKVVAVNPAGISSGSADAKTKTFEPVKQAIPVDYSTASGWAVPEIKEAAYYNLVTDKLLNNFKKDITREEFCEIAVKLYEVLSGNKTLPSKSNPFTDTKNEEVVKAYQLGIVNGISKTTFGPNNTISRQEICVMIFGALKAANPTISSDTSGVGEFVDEKSIASWAIAQVRFAAKHGVMKGTNGKILPLEKVTREQAFVLLKRTYDSFKQ